MLGPGADHRAGQGAAPASAEPFTEWGKLATLGDMTTEGGITKRWQARDGAGASELPGSGPLTSPAVVRHASPSTLSTMTPAQRATLWRAHFAATCIQVLATCAMEGDRWRGEEGRPRDHRRWLERVLPDQATLQEAVAGRATAAGVVQMQGIAKSVGDTFVDSEGTVRWRELARSVVAATEALELGKATDLQLRLLHGVTSNLRFLDVATREVAASVGLQGRRGRVEVDHDRARGVATAALGCVALDSMNWHDPRKALELHRVVAEEGRTGDLQLRVLVEDNARRLVTPATGLDPAVVSTFAEEASSAARRPRAVVPGRERSVTTSVSASTTFGAQAFEPRWMAKIIGEQALLLALLASPGVVDVVRSESEGQRLADWVRARAPRFGNDREATASVSSSLKGSLLRASGTLPTDASLAMLGAKQLVDQRVDDLSRTGALYRGGLDDSARAAAHSAFPAAHDALAAAIDSVVGNVGRIGWHRAGGGTKVSSAAERALRSALAVPEVRTVLGADLAQRLVDRSTDLTLS